MDVSENLKSACDDLTELEGKQVELIRKKSKLNNHKQVFLAELERINDELEEVSTSLDDVNKQYSSARWRRLRLRVSYLFQILLHCLYYIGTFLAFLSINLLYLLYYILAAAAYLSRAILDSQMKSFSGRSKTGDLDDSLSWS